MAYAYGGGGLSMLLDNKKNGKVGDELRRHLSSGTRLSVLSALFSIYGFESLKKELNSLAGARLLLCPERDDEDIGDEHYYAQELFKQEELSASRYEDEL